MSSLIEHDTPNVTISFLGLTPTNPEEKEESEQ